MYAVSVGQLRQRLIARKVEDSASKSASKLDLFLKTQCGTPRETEIPRKTRNPSGITSRSFDMVWVLFPFEKGAYEFKFMGFWFPT
jgi:hypothetical protein